MNNGLTSFKKRVIIFIGLSHAFDEYGFMTAAGLSELLWPGSDTLTSTKNGGRGAQVGKGAWLSAGSHVGKLKKQGYVCDYISPHTRRRGYRLTQKGVSVFKELVAKEVASSLLQGKL